MKWMYIWVLAPFFLLSGNLKAPHSIPTSKPTETTTTAQFCISPQEKALIDEINAYRKRKRLPPVAISPSMMIVAREHARELNDEIKKLTHAWTDCDYDSKTAKRPYDCMWQQPRRLTNYPGKGYECAYAKWGSPSTPKEVLQGWQESPSHNNIIINRDIWKTSDWKAIGVAMYGNYATLWLGEKVDPAGTAVVCKDMKSPTPKVTPIAAKPKTIYKKTKRKVIRRKRKVVRRRSSNS